ncbi:MAG: hypothetical protein GTO63_20455, partial [Anaerolineae bacterium]|nr:hypothetical protein [Anaerolineae bacterium]NIN97146.1 hypothetical protein [Anaerolineae bacterium]NIQ80119.1 hypothetical protein [Anaerolineae bacterium]
MPTIEDFLQHAYDEYEVGKGDTKFHIGELEPQVEDTEDGVTYWLKPLQRTFFGTKDPVFNLNDWSFYQLCKRLSPIQVKLDPRYIRACSPALGLKQLRFWREVFKEREALLRLKTDPHSGRVEIRGILSGLYHPLDAHMVGNILKKELKDREIEYAVTPRRWNVTFWEDMQSDDAWYHVGFRVMGSEVGAIRRLRMDVLLRFRTEKGRVILPVLINSRPLAAIPYSNNGVTGLPKLTDNFQRGLTVASSAKEAAESRMDQELAYPADEFMDV